MVLFVGFPARAIDFSGGSYRVKKSGESITTVPIQIKSSSPRNANPVFYPVGSSIRIESSPIQPALPRNGEVVSIEELLQLAPKVSVPQSFGEASPQIITPTTADGMVNQTPAKPYLNHEVFGRLLAKYVTKSNWFNYREFLKEKENLEDLKAYVEDLCSLNPSTLEDQADKVAAWINLYNAIVLLEIAQKYPIQNVMQIRNLFGEKKYKIGDRVWSLIEIEEEVFQKEIMDPRTVFSRVNGSSSGPKFLKEAYDPYRLDAQLEEQTWKFLSDPQNVRFDKKRLTLYLNATFLWYEKELIDVNAFLRNYLNLLPKYFQVAYTGYDWRLNDEKLH